MSRNEEGSMTIDDRIREVLSALCLATLTNHFYTPGHLEEVIASIKKELAAEIRNLEVDLRHVNHHLVEEELWRVRELIIRLETSNDKS
jgi:hypothetical protein